MNSAQKKYYTVKEASDILGVSTNTLYKYLDEGKIKARRFGHGRFKIPFAELNPYVEEKVGGVENSGIITLEPQKNESFSPVMSTEFQTNAPEAIDSMRKVSEEMVGATQEKKQINTNLSPPTLVGFCSNDIFFFRSFKAMIYLGLGIIYFISTPTNTSLSLTAGVSLANFFSLVLPYALITVGFLNLFEIIFGSKKILNHTFIDALSILVSGYYTFLALSSGNYGLFVFTASLTGIALSHLISDVKDKNNDYSHTFLNSFTRFTLLLSLMGGIAITLNPSIFPISIAINMIENSRELFAFLWFVLLVFPPAVILYQTNRKSIVIVPFFTLSSVFIFIIGVKLMLFPKWDTAYMSFLVAIFGLFLAWWSESRVVFDLKKIKFMLISFSWISVVILLSLYTLDIFRNQEKIKSVERIQLSLNELSKTINDKFNERSSIMTSFAGNNDLKNSISSNDEEKNVNYAKQIYDQMGSVNRVVIYNNVGLAVGVYPRNTLVQGANFSSRVYFQETVTSKRGTISEVFQSVVGTTTVIQTEPIFENNEVVGVVGVATSPTNFAFAFGINDLVGIMVEITDRNRVQVLSETISNPDFGKRSSLYNNIGSNESEIALARKLNYPDWTVSLSGSHDTTLSGLSSLTNSLVAIIIFNTLFSVFTGIFLTKNKNNEDNIYLIGQDFMSGTRVVSV